jgi:hypothetical protein
MRNLIRFVFLMMMPCRKKEKKEKKREISGDFLFSWRVFVLQARYSFVEEKSKEKRKKQHTGKSNF